MPFQVAVGVRLAWHWSSLPVDAYRVFQIGSGVYLAAFVVTGRFGIRGQIERGRSRQ
jgi:hypothetical protein